MTLRSGARTAATVLAASLLVVATAGCGGSSAADPAPRGACPQDPVRVVVTIAPWTDLATGSGGDCAVVTTVLQSTAADPHEYEPSPADAASFTGAQVVVANGAGYDAWADKLVATLDPPPEVVAAAAVGQVSDGADPHLWYAPDIVHRMGDAVTAALTAAAPGLAGYFTAAAERWRAQLAPYDAKVAATRHAVSGRAYAATEPVFDRMAEALGMRDLTPDGWRRAAANDSQPGPGDVLELQSLLGRHGVDVLVFNPQTQGAATNAVRDDALAAGVPVVDVTETFPAGTTSFVGWQLGQLDAIAAALDVG